MPLTIHNGRPLVSGVYVNGRGPYRFLVDTGSTFNYIDPAIASSIGLTETFRTSLRSANGVTTVSGSEGGEVRLGGGCATAQVFLAGDMRALHAISPEIQGVIGQVFLSRFDYEMDLGHRKLRFGATPHEGDARVPFSIVAGRPVITTSLGALVLDSGVRDVTRFGARTADAGSQLMTAAGSTIVGTVAASVAIGGRTIWRGDAVAVPQSIEDRVEGLLPVGVFQTIYVSNSGRYVILK